MYDFHTHTFLSDGVLSPIELIRRAMSIGYRVMAITDHVGPGNMEFVLKTLAADCEMASRRWDILALPGVEITHTPSEDIDRLARECRRLGAVVVNVHGETITEPVVEGTNLAAVSSDHVDILAHPGLITLEEARIARAQRRLLGSVGAEGTRNRQRPRRQDGASRRRANGAGLRRPRTRRPADARLRHESRARLRPRPRRRRGAARPRPVRRPQARRCQPRPRRVVLVLTPRPAYLERGRRTHPLSAHPEPVEERRS